MIAQLLELLETASNMITSPDMPSNVRASQTRTPGTRTTVELVRGLLCSSIILAFLDLFSILEMPCTPLQSTTETTCGSQNAFSLPQSQRLSPQCLAIQLYISYS